MMLSLVRHIPLATVSMHEGEWRKKEHHKELFGFTRDGVGMEVLTGAELRAARHESSESSERSHCPARFMM